MDLNQLWQTTLGEIELQISRANFLTWLKNSRPLEKEANQGMLTVALPSNFAKEWVENKYHKIILGTIRSLDPSIKRIEYAVVSDRGQLVKTRIEIAKGHEQETIPELKIDPETNLHPRYTLGSFVVGSSNELSYAAAQAIIKDVGKKYNPLFVYGGTGLGKTHLIQGIGNEIKTEHKGRLMTKYVTSEKFVSDVVWAIRNKRADDVKEKYRNVDVLIVDDIQFIGGKERSEEEFFHTFNALYEHNRQIIISSDRPPAAIPTLEARLRSRFEGGMITDITYPDYEMRLAIIKTKLEERRAQLPDDVSELIASKVQRNIREIEGIVNKILFYQEVKNIEPTTKIVEEIIANIVQQSARNITPAQVIKAVADFYEILPSDFINRSRKKGVVEPRQISAFLLRDVLNMSYPEIGEKLGKRDHSTVIYAYEKISAEVNKNQALNQKMILIKEIINKNQ